MWLKMNILITSKSHFQSLHGRLTSVNNKSANPSRVSQLWATQQNLKPIITHRPLAWSQYYINFKNHSVLEQYFTPDLKARRVWTIYQISGSQVWYLFILPRHLLEMRKLLSQETEKERRAKDQSNRKIAFGNLFQTLFKLRTLVLIVHVWSGSKVF